MGLLSAVKSRLEFLLDGVVTKKRTLLDDSKVPSRHLFRISPPQQVRLLLTFAKCPPQVLKEAVDDRTRSPFKAPSEQPSVVNTLPTRLCMLLGINQDGKTSFLNFLLAITFTHAKAYWEFVASKYHNYMPEIDELEAVRKLG